MASGNGGWLRPLAATLIIQLTSAMLIRLVPTIAPTIAQARGLSDSVIGYLAGISTLGAILFLVLGGPIMRRYGPIRSLQLGLAAGGFGLAMLAVDSTALLVVGILLMGLGYGPSSPAGTEVLQRYAPPRHRSLIFSIKQSGIPLGGALAGLTLPAIAAISDWRYCLLFTFAILAGAVILVQSMREGIDADRDRAQKTNLGVVLSWSNMSRPLRTVMANRAVTRMALAGTGLGITQGAWFAFFVTICVTEIGLSLSQAGLLFAITQGISIPGRLVLGHVADRIGSGRLVLKFVALTSGFTSFAFALVTPDWPFAALVAFSAVSGLTISSWNGIQVAEVARLSSRPQLQETTSGASVLLYLGYIAGPTGFAWLQSATGSSTPGLVAIGAISLAGFFVIQGKMAENAPP